MLEVEHNFILFIYNLIYKFNKMVSVYLCPDSKAYHLY